jgi:hypothetical protein
MARREAAHASRLTPSLIPTQAMGLLAAPPGQRQGSRIASTVRQIAPSFGALDALTRSITWDFRSRLRSALLIARLSWPPIREGSEKSTESTCPGRICERDGSPRDRVPPLSRAQGRENGSRGQSLPQE